MPGADGLRVSGSIVARVSGPLALVDGGRLLRLFIDREGETPIGQLAVAVVARGGQQQRHGPFHFVVLGAPSARVALLRGHGQGETAFALQQLQRIAGLAHSLFFCHGQDLVFQLVAAQVVERRLS